MATPVSFDVVFDAQGNIDGIFVTFDDGRDVKLNVPEDITLPATRTEMEQAALKKL